MWRMRDPGSRTAVPVAHASTLASPSGAAIPGATITVSGSGGFVKVASSDVNGAFTVAGIARSGALDPGLMLYLLRTHDLEPHQLDRLLNEGSGLSALGGGGGEMPELTERANRGDRRAALALSLYRYRVAGAVAAMTVALEGLDALAFTGGIGEHDTATRSEVCRRLSFLGVQLDGRRNQAATPDCRVDAQDSPVAVHVVASREELVIARAVRALVGSPDQQPAGQTTARPSLSPARRRS